MPLGVLLISVQCCYPLTANLNSFLLACKPHAGNENQLPLSVYCLRTNVLLLCLGPILCIRRQESTFLMRTHKTL